MSAQARPLGARLPALGTRGEGWVVGQLLLIGALLLSGLAGPSRSGDLRAAGLIVGTGLIAAGLGLMAAGIAWLKRQLTPFPRPVPDGELITDGPFGLVRHPVYTGGVIVAVGWALATASLPAFAVAALFLLFLDLKSRREEAWLTEQFSAYAAYAARTPKLIPFLY
jgi:protein-S-isoprenylcysteine O-methyltransferase Ste14